MAQLPDSPPADDQFLSGAIRGKASPLVESTSSRILLQHPERDRAIPLGAQAVQGKLHRWMGVTVAPFIRMKVEGMNLADIAPFIPGRPLYAEPNRPSIGNNGVLSSVACPESFLPATEPLLHTEPCQVVIGDYPAVSHLPGTNVQFAQLRQHPKCHRTQLNHLLRLLRSCPIPPLFHRGVRAPCMTPLSARHFPGNSEALEHSGQFFV